MCEDARQHTITSFFFLNVQNVLHWKLYFFFFLHPVHSSYAEKLRLSVCWESESKMSFLEVDDETLKKSVMRRTNWLWTPLKKTRAALIGTSRQRDVVNCDEKNEMRHNGERERISNIQQMLEVKCVFLRAERNLLRLVTINIKRLKRLQQILRLT